MDTNAIFFSDPSPTSTSTQPLAYLKPRDDYHPVPHSTSSIFYLAVTTPHTDTYMLHGPVRSFSALLPTITALASDSPSALDKLENLSYSAPDVWGNRTTRASFLTHGFRTLIVDGERGTYTVLQVLTEENAGVKDVLPAPVYTVTRHGPLVYAYDGLGAKARLGAARGVAASSELVGCFAERKEAVSAARKAMDGMVEGERKVNRIENLGKHGEDGGMLLALGNGVRWEVRVKYDSEVLKIARESAEKEGAGLAWRF
ncbi:hypothetical protein E8E13_004392 [Curvularia kusanoi]|uniref:Uncharacterized protein n=1 Tax=Curvularia kusanoi TaxID=90978 RepID=A0A9P4T8N1_CURKU|nr:hypothetical protein E8E13_004392 [Curvularia kusanoi]